METKQKPKTESELQLLELGRIETQLKKLNKNMSKFQTMLRGFVYGIASGIGATVGLAIVLFILARILSAYSYVPVVNQILNITKLNNITQTQPFETDNAVLKR